ncbi:MAG: FAD-dependent oxidoreductase [Oscillospiraceae bacterium]|nr:FAD-dependent oxidoreductase [Oscillospiraceae bacterium]
MTQVKYLIIGAGISGLTAANYLKDDYLIIEKEPEVGGYCRTIKKGDYVWDYAGHFFHFKTDEFKKLFIDNMSPDEILYKEKCTKILYKGALVDYPFQMNIHQLDKPEFIDCLYDLFNKEEKPQYDNFLDMLYGKFGRSIVEKFLKPYNEKLYACDLQTLDVDAMGRFFPYADKTQIINNMKKEQDSSYNLTFLYPKNGAFSFIKLIYDSLDKSRVLLNTRIESIDMDTKTVRTSDGNEYRFEYLINSAPLNHFLKLFGKPELDALESRLSYNKVLVFNLGFSKKSAFTDEHWIYIPEKDANYYRIGFYDNILDADKLSMYIEIGYSKDAKIDVDGQLRLTLENLKKHGVVDDENSLEEYVSIIMDPAYVHINRDTDRSIKALKEELKERGIFTVGRYGGWTYCSMEDCMLEVKELTENIM